MFSPGIESLSLLNSGSWGDIPYSAMVYKISNLGESSGRCSFLVLGMNPRRPFDSQYSDWLDAVSQHCRRASFDSIKGKGLISCVSALPRFNDTSS